MVCWAFDERFDLSVVAGDELHATFNHPQDRVLASGHRRLLLKDELDGLLNVHAPMLGPGDRNNNSMGDKDGTKRAAHQLINVRFQRKDAVQGSPLQAQPADSEWALLAGERKPQVSSIPPVKSGARCVTHLGVFTLRCSLKRP